MQLRLFVFLLFWGSIAVGQPNTLGTAFLGTDGCYTLTTNGPGQVGVVWFEDTLDLTKPFVIDTRVLLGSSDFGADGMVIVLMNDPGNSIGLDGQQLGYGSLTNAFGAEIDIFQNGSDPAYDHVAYHTGGTVIHAPSPALSAPVSALPGNANIEDQNWHRAQLYWYPDSQKLDLYIDCSLRLSRTVDLQSILGVSEVQWGATAATGAWSATIRICMEYAGNSTNDTINQCFGTIQPNFFTPYIQTYSWSPTTGVSDPTIPNPLISPFQATTYTLTRTDSCGIQRFDTLTINAFNGVDPLPPATIICEGDTFFADLGVYPNYTWSDGATANSRPLTQPGTYSVTITDQGSGCSVIDSIQLFVADLNLQATNVNVCYGDTTEISARPPFAAFWSDFDNGLSAGWLPADTMSYLYEQTAGPFGNDTAQWTLLNLPEHDQVTVSFTLYIFDSWDGNNLPDGPDLWGFRADGSSIINTAFSNVSSNQQSYPDDYQIDYPAFTGSAMQDLPPRCTPTSRTTVYNIQRTFSHSDCDLVLEWFGNLTNAGSAPWCDESWAIDNVVATTNTAPPTSGCPPGFSWSNGAVTTTFIDTITDTTTYVYTADFGSIICSDTLVVNKLGNPFDPFQDSLFICWDQQVTLNAGSGYVSFLWSTGATTQTIVLSAGGQYWVEAYDDAFSCLGRDSVWIERTAEPLLTSDTTLCEGSLLQLSLDTLYGPDYQVLWSTGVAVNSISLNVSASDTVWVAVSNSQITCYDSLYVNGANYHLLLDDTTVWCPNEPLLYSAVQGADRYDWSTGDSTANTYFLDQGWYYLTVTSGSCIQRDSLWHQWFNDFNGVDPLPPATIICEGDTFFADLGVYPNYTWSDGATANSRPLTQPGTYSVTITDQGSGCSVIDSIQLFVADLNLQATNVNVCYGDTTEISARPPFAAFWSDFDNGLSAGWLPADTMSYLYEQTAGPFGNDTAQWTLLNLPEHDQVTVSFTLYIFDSWDGNNLPDGPDLWGFRADGSSIINTAFSNVSSNQQSYPDDYQIDYPAFTGSAMQDLPPRCTPTSRTTVYNIQRTFSHSDCDLVLEWFGNLTNAGSAPWCDESWAIDNVVATTNTAPPTSGCPPGFSWSNGAVTTTFIDTITDTTTYVYTADFGSIICSDTLVVNKLGNPFDPFQDSLFICWDQQVTLNAGSGYVSFLWSTGATTQTIVLSAGGQYWVEAYDDAFSCLGRDSVWIERTAEPLLTSDTTLCEGSLLQLSLDTLYGPDYQVLWSTGVAVNSISLNVSASDTVWVAVSNSQITCYDSLYVNGANYHLLLDDTTVWCPNEPLLYSAVQGADRYDWSTGDSTANTYFLDQGWYYLTVTSGSCIQRDSLWHQWFNDYSDIVPDSTAECSPYALDLSNLPWTTMNVEPVGYSGNYIVLDQSDTYYLSGTDFNGCAVADTMILWIGVYPDVELYYQEDCPTTSLWYTSNDTATFQGWSIDGNEIPAPQLDTVIQGYENLELTAWLHNYCGVDSAFVTYEPGCFPRGVIYIPNAFTPNGDNANDYFRPQGDEFEKFEYQIFNRWGELVFNGDDKDSGWDGSVNGEPVSTITVFVVRVRVWYSDGTIEEERTTLRLIR